MHAVESFRLGPFKICQDLFPISILCGFLFQVTYCVSGMLEKNRDTLSQNILECLQHSESGMIYELFSSHFSENGALVVRYVITVLTLFLFFLLLLFSVYITNIVIRLWNTFDNVQCSVCEQNC